MGFGLGVATGSVVTGGVVTGGVVMGGVVMGGVVMGGVVMGGVVMGGVTTGAGSTTGSGTGGSTGSIFGLGDCGTCIACPCPVCCAIATPGTAKTNARAKMPCILRIPAPNFMKLPLIAKLYAASCRGHVVISKKSAKFRREFCTAA